MIVIDGSMGEGGGQILRSSLALSLITGQPFKIKNIRAKRSKPGLMRQHLTAVRAAQTVGTADVEGDAIGSMELVFKPGSVRPGEYTFLVGTAGSTTLVLQTVLPALLLQSKPSLIAIEGGTHNLAAPPYDFLESSFLPQLAHMGFPCRSQLVRPGFYPAGGGSIRVHVEKSGPLKALHLHDRGERKNLIARALIAELGTEIGRRELKQCARKLGIGEEQQRLERMENSRGPGNVVLIEAEFEKVCAVFCGFGRIGATAEKVAGEAIGQARKYLTSEAPVDPFLADQLLLPMAIVGEGSFTTSKTSLHFSTNSAVIQRFLQSDIRVVEGENNLIRIEVETRHPLR